MLDFSNAAYGVTKVAQHFYTRAMHIEEPWLISLTIDPGSAFPLSDCKTSPANVGANRFVQTDMGTAAAHWFGIDKAAISVEESTAGVVGVIDASTKDTHSGKLFTYLGPQVAW